MTVKTILWKSEMEVSTTVVFLEVLCSVCKNQVNATGVIRVFKTCGFLNYIII